MATFTYKFDELPLCIAADGIEAGLINGSIDIQYNRRGEWGVVVGTVCLEGWRPRAPEEIAAGKKAWVYVPAPASVANTIIHRLEHEWCDRVESAIQDQLEAEREAAAEDRADMIRDLRKHEERM